MSFESWGERVPKLMASLDDRKWPPPPIPSRMLPYVFDFFVGQIARGLANGPRAPLNGPRVAGARPPHRFPAWGFSDHPQLVDVMGLDGPARPGSRAKRLGANLKCRRVSQPPGAVQTLKLDALRLLGT